MPEVAIVSGKDVREMLNTAIKLIGGLDRYIEEDSVVLIKPNIGGGIPGKPGSHTNVMLLRGLVDILSGIARKVIVGEADSVMYWADEQFNLMGVRDALKGTNAEIVNLSRGELVEIEVPNALVMPKIAVSRILTEVDHIISVPVMKTHALTKVSLGMKCMFGALPLKKKTIYHKMGLDGVIVDVNKAFPPTLTIIDGIVGMEGAGPFHGDPIEMDVLICGDNVAAVDAVGAYIMGYEPKEIEHLRIADAAGIGPIELSKIKIRGEDAHKIRRKFRQTPKVLKSEASIGEAFCKISASVASIMYHKAYMGAWKDWERKMKSG
ncbi:MAG: hypothetical protein DRN91_00670 [Candidatus Alkanophagales archaeon]|nr:MAG: hypothetical protein DRN91_00670 [Candidatus Alkanophagales archaeon]